MRHLSPRLSLSLGTTAFGLMAIRYIHFILSLSPSMSHDNFIAWCCAIPFVAGMVWITLTAVIYAIVSLTFSILKHFGTYILVWRKIKSVARQDRSQ